MFSNSHISVSFLFFLFIFNNFGASFTYGFHHFDSILLNFFDTFKHQILFLTYLTRSKSSLFWILSLVYFIFSLYPHYTIFYNIVF